MFFMSKLNLHHNATDKLKQQGGRKRREAGRKKGRKRRKMEYRTGKGRKRGSWKRRRNGKRGINKMSSCDFSSLIYTCRTFTSASTALFTALANTLTVAELLMI